MTLRHAQPRRPRARPTGALGPRGALLAGLLAASGCRTPPSDPGPPSSHSGVLGPIPADPAHPEATFPGACTAYRVGPAPGSGAVVPYP